MSDIKNKQHYVFQSYLRKWCNDNKLWCYKKSERRVFQSSTGGVLHKHRMYRIQELNDDERQFFELVMTVMNLNDADKSEMHDHINMYLQPYKNQKIVDTLKSINPVPESHPLNEELQKAFENLEELIKKQKINTEEDFYSNYESDGKVWIDKLIAGDTSFYYNIPKMMGLEIDSVNEKCDFLNFICIQYFRTDGIRKQIAENIQKMLELFIDYKDTSGGIKYVNFNYENVNPAHILPHMIWIMQTKCSAGLIKAEIQIVRNKTRLPFITSDQPVINMKAEIGKEAPDEFVLWYPLSPEVGVIINGGSGEREIDKKLEVDMLNRLIWDHSFEYVMGDRKELLDGMVDMY